MNIGREKGATIIEYVLLLNIAIFVAVVLFSPPQVNTFTGADLAGRDSVAGGVQRTFNRVSESLSRPEMQCAGGICRCVANC